jgi:hypothetical protein
VAKENVGVTEYDFAGMSVLSKPFSQMADVITDTSSNSKTKEFCHL